MRISFSKLICGPRFSTLRSCFAFALSVAFCVLTVLSAEPPGASAQSLASQLREQLRSGRDTEAKQHRRHESKSELSTRAKAPVETTHRVEGTTRAPAAGGQKPAVEREKSNVEEGNEPDPRRETLIARTTQSIGAEAAAKIFQGDPGDVLVLLNERTSARHVSRILSGEVKFKDNIADVCRLSSNNYFEESLDFYVQTQLRKINPDFSFSKYLITSQICEPTLTSDLLVVRRGTIINLEKLGFGIADALIRRQTSLFLVVPIAQYQTLKSSVTALQQANEAQIAAGTLDGFGSIIIPDGDRHVVCADNEVDPDLVRALVLETRKLTIFEPRTADDTSVVSETPDEIFVRAKRLGCGFIAGETGLLKVMISGLHRDGIVPIVSSVIIPEAIVRTTAQEIISKKQNFALQQRIDDEAKAKKAADDQAANELRLKEEQQRLQALKI